MNRASGTWLTDRSRLSRPELVTSALAVLISSTGYALGQHAYLARGVVGDLVGLGLLSAVAAATGRRLIHEALLCLALIGVVLLLEPDWPLRSPDALWWSLFVVALGGYVVLRNHTTTRRAA